MFTILNFDMHATRKITVVYIAIKDEFECVPIYTSFALDFNTH